MNQSIICDSINAPIEDFLGYTIKHDLSEMMIKIYQPNIITKMNQGVNKDMKSLMTFNKPTAQHKGVVSYPVTDTKISNNIQNRYRNGVGSLLYLVNNSLFKLSNIVCELSKIIDDKDMSQYRALLIVFNFLIDKKILSNI